MNDNKRTHPTIFRKWYVVIFLAAGLMFGSQACVSNSKYKLAVDERDVCVEEKTQLVGQVDQLQGEKEIAGNQIQRLQAEKQELDNQLREERNTTMAARGLYDDLVSHLQSEIAVQKITVNMMKSGLTLTLPSEVLFPSGSAELKESGKETLLKVGEDLKDVRYQTVVGGFTDDVPIGPQLVKRYPTNWELAGARAASVVRLLEKSGVASKRLLAVSFGENQPLVSNDTEEGRAQNRRIEIRLRPVEVAE